MERKPIQKKGRHYTREEQHLIIQEMLKHGCSKKEIWKKYTGQEEEHGQLLRWMRKLGYSDTVTQNQSTFERNQKAMPRKKQMEQARLSYEESFENLQLKKRIFELERQLKDAELKAIAYSTMVDIAEKEFKIPIRKKLNTKP